MKKQTTCPTCHQDVNLPTDAIQRLAALTVLAEAVQLSAMHPEDYTIKARITQTIDTLESNGWLNTPLFLQSNKGLRTSKVLKTTQELTGTA